MLASFTAYLLLLEREQSAFWYAGQGCGVQAAAGGSWRP